MTKWEYKADLARDSDDIVGVANTWGKEGWEVFTLRFMKDGFIGIYMKRMVGK